MSDRRDHVVWCRKVDTHAGVGFSSTTTSQRLYATWWDHRHPTGGMNWSSSRQEAMRFTPDEAVALLLHLTALREAGGLDRVSEWVFGVGQVGE